MSTSPALTALRERRAQLGLKRLELYVHPDDWASVKAYAAKAQRRRERAAGIEQPAPAKRPARGSPELSAALQSLSREEQAPRAVPPAPSAVAQRLARRLARRRP